MVEGKLILCIETRGEQEEEKVVKRWGAGVRRNLVCADMCRREEMNS